MKIIIDYDRTLFNPDSGTLYPGVFDLLGCLRKRHDIFLVSRNEPGRMARFNGFGIRDYFREIAFVDEKTESIFRSIGGRDGKAIVIGDSIKDEIRIGNRLGYPTVRIEQGKFGKDMPAHPEENPRHSVRSIGQLVEILNIINAYEN
jgi:FMN phosphatase YigB (HAD superfamily)